MNVFQDFYSVFFSRWQKSGLFSYCPCFLWILHQMFPKMEIKYKRKARNYYFTRRKKYLSFLFPSSKKSHLWYKRSCHVVLSALFISLSCSTWYKRSRSLQFWDLHLPVKFSFYKIQSDYGHFSILLISS